MFAVGDNVKIIDGPFCDFEARVEQLLPLKEKARVSLLIFGRAETIEVNFSQIKPAAAN